MAVESYGALKRINRKIYVKIQGEEKNITEYTIILWGAGNYARVMCQNLFMDEPKYVIDSDISKSGTKIQLYQEERVISSPSILSEYDSKDCFILIANKYYSSEIAKTIEEDYPLWRNRYANIFSVYFKYNSLRDMMCNDRTAMERACMSNILIFLPEYINIMEMLIKDKLGLKNGDYEIWPVHNSTRVVFFISAINGKQYIGRLPSWDKYNTSFSYRESVIKVKKKEKMDLLTLYEDKIGFGLSFVGDEINDWNNEIVIDGVRASIKTIHDSALCVEESFDGAKYVRFEQFKRLVPDINEVLVKEIKNECSKRIIGLCHNDLHCGNVLLYKNKVALIDFEHVAMGDVIFDTCRFIMDLLFFRNCRLFGSIEEAGDYFFGKCSSGKVVHIYACVIVHLVNEIIKHQNNSEDVSWQIKELKGMIDRYSECLRKEQL